ncbi:hypothetical protein WG66_002167 [Moniliophthora roreri]|nr:hypothetical protein WG66_002167 [Moniliophthora roreri]
MLSKTLPVKFGQEDFVCKVILTFHDTSIPTLRGLVMERTGHRHCRTHRGHQCCFAGFKCVFLSQYETNLVLLHWSSVYRPLKRFWWIHT